MNLDDLCPFPPPETVEIPKEGLCVKYTLPDGDQCTIVAYPIAGKVAGVESGVFLDFIRAGHSYPLLLSMQGLDAMQRLLAHLSANGWKVRP